MRKRALFLALPSSPTRGRAATSSRCLGGLRGFSAGLCLALASGLLASCGSTPTLPLPPPVVGMLLPPDLQGLVTVQGEANEDAYVTVFNQQSNHGEITLASATGHFELKIEAASHDQLLIWQENEGIKGEVTEQTVPEAARP